MVIRVDMIDYVKCMFEEFSQKVRGSDTTPSTDNVFKVGTSLKQLGPETRETSHTFIMRDMFLRRRGRPYYQPLINFLNTSVQDLHENDWSKLIRLLRQIEG